MPSEIEKWKKQLALGKAKRDKELGKEEMLLKTIKVKFGVSSLQELEALISQLEKEYAEVSKEFEEKTNEFRTKFAEKLEAISG